MTVGMTGKELEEQEWGFRSDPSTLYVYMQIK